MDPEEVSFMEKNDLKFIKVIAQGNFGTIYQVYSEKFKGTFALKKVPKKFFYEQEVECLTAIDDPRIVSLYKCLYFNDYIYLLMEYCMTDLFKIFTQNPKMSGDMVKKYITEVVKDVKACHDRNVAHSDIKPANFMVDMYGRIKIGDFGLSKIYKDKPKSLDFKGSGFYMAPEIFSRQFYNPIVADVWSLGVMIYLMHTRTFPFEAQNEKEFYQKISVGVYNTELITDPDLADVIAHCLVVDPYKRSTVDELLQLKYFNASNPSPERLPLIRKSTTSKSNCIFKPKVERKKILSLQMSQHDLLRTSSAFRIQRIDSSSSSDRISLDELR